MTRGRRTPDRFSHNLPILNYPLKIGMDELFEWHNLSRMTSHNRLAMAGILMNKHMIVRSAEKMTNSKK
jgi:hypothetical protein